jgi:NitT/TauT family transport system ATP-binding protein
MLNLRAMSNCSIDLKNVTLAFGEGRDAVTALENFTLAIRPGEFLSVLGPSGCGKSSLISMIAGFLPPRFGALRVDGEPGGEPDSDRGVVFQQATLFPWKTVRQNVEFGLKLRGVPRRERRAIVDLILFKVGLFEFDKHFPAQLSSGMQQRVGLARVLVNRPRVMLMDEPFSSLDAQTRLMMQELLLNVWGEYRMTVLFVTHDIDEAVYLGSRVAVLTRRPGRLKALFDVDLPRPRTVDVLVSRETQAQLHGSRSGGNARFPGTQGKTCQRSRLCRIPSRIGGRCRLEQMPKEISKVSLYRSRAALPSLPAWTPGLIRQNGPARVQPKLARLKPEGFQFFGRRVADENNSPYSSGCSRLCSAL